MLTSAAMEREGVGALGPSRWCCVFTGSVCVRASLHLSLSLSLCVHVSLLSLVWAIAAEGRQC